MPRKHHPPMLETSHDQPGSNAVGFTLPAMGGNAFCSGQEYSIITTQSAPERPIVEVRDSNQFLNFDMVVRNRSNLTLRISQIELSVYDSAHH
jgi:hypothetical protein